MARSGSRGKGIGRIARATEPHLGVGQVGGLEPALRDARRHRKICTSKAYLFSATESVHLIWHTRAVRWCAGMVLGSVLFLWHQGPSKTHCCTKLPTQYDNAVLY